MATEDKTLEGVVGRSLPTRQGDNTLAPYRISNYGDAYVQHVGLHRSTISDEGGYFVATNPTPGTGIAGIAATGAFSDAESLLLLQNDNSESSAKRVYLDYLRLISTAAGANGTNVRYVLKLDDAERYTSGGSTITPVNANMASSTTSGCTCLFGALITTSAGSNVRLIANGLIRSVITVVGDNYTFDFGGEAPATAGLAVAGTAINHSTVRVPPVILGPGDSLVLSLHAASQSAATSFEFELAYWER